VILGDLLEGGTVAKTLSMAGIAAHPNVQIGLAPTGAAPPDEVDRDVVLSG
jgi:hypothetical protein